jgi:glycosyltransferase involved in cell wall biosynthesis
MAHGIVDHVVVVDDASHDDTIPIARTLDRVQVEVHPVNLGYGANQKTCYRLALTAGADIIIMIHPDYQYTPQLIRAMAALVASGLYPCVLASRILGGGALRGGMPWWKYVANRFLTFVENLLLGAKLSEYHTGYRAFTRKLLERLPLDTNSDDFVFCQPGSGTSYRIRLRDRGSDLPGAVFTGGFVDKLPEKRALWTGMSLHPFAFPFCALGAGSSDRLTNVRR